MSEDNDSTNPFLNAWAKAQTQMLETQAPFWKQMSEAMLPSADTTDLVKSAEVAWEKARKEAGDWMAQIADKSGFAPSGNGIGQETLQRMMDPGQFLYAGSDELNQTIQKLVEGPEFSDIGSLERQGLRATKEWISLREASAEYRIVTARAWGRAFERYSKVTSEEPEILKKGARALMTKWLEIANDELTATQRTSDFLKAQRKLLRAGVDFRLRDREMVEAWCETHSMPTRTEVDDLHALVYQLRRDVRALKKERSVRSKPASKSTKRASPKTTTRSES